MQFSSCYFRDFGLVIFWYKPEFLFCTVAVHHAENGGQCDYATTIEFGNRCQKKPGTNLCLANDQKDLTLQTRKKVQHQRCGLKDEGEDQR